MFELTRTVRFSVSLWPEREDDSARHNTFAGWPSLSGLGAYYEIEVHCRGPVDANTGYLMNISVIDEAVRSYALPIVREAMHHEPPTFPGIVLGRILSAVSPPLGRRVSSIRWRLTPYHAVAMETARPDRVLLSQQFEFAAAHRLHCPELSDEDNRRVFGRCNNRHGHGHNYRLEVTVAVPLPVPAERPPLTLPALERVVDETVIRRFDHTNLNLDLEEFRTLNPSVEHIARTCFELLRAPVAAAGGSLDAVTVWETEKTSCTYRADAPGA